METNQLPDGGAFDRIEVADMEEGVSQRYAWGGDAGILEVTFRQGYSELVSLRLNEFEQVEGKRTIEPCHGWPREAFAARIGVDLREGKSTTHRARDFVISRYVLATERWAVRARCAAGSANECYELSTVFESAEASLHAQISPSDAKPKLLARRPLK